MAKAVTITPDAPSSGPVTITPDGTQDGSDSPGFLNTLGREVSSFGSTVANIPSAVYHAAADPASSEEKQRFGQNFEHDIGPTGRLIHRMAVQPVENAVDWYAQAAQGKVPNAYEQALSVAPEAMGGAGAAVVAPRAAKWATTDLPEAISDLPGRRIGSAAWAGAKGALAKTPIAGKMATGGLRAAVRNWKSTAPTLDSETGSEVSPPRLIQQMGGEPAETITDTPSGRLVLSPEEAQAEMQQMSLAKKMASQRGMQYAAGMRPAPPQ